MFQSKFGAIGRPFSLNENLSHTEVSQGRVIWFIIASKDLCMSIRVNDVFYLTVFCSIDKLFGATR